jgi:thioredoxin-like negative regulator of GroEL
LIHSSNLQAIKDQVELEPSVVLLLSSKGCSVCTAVEAQLQQLETRYPNTLFLMAKLDDEPELSGEYLVFTVPTVLVFQNGREIHRASRFIRWTQLAEALDWSLHEKKPYE